MKSFLLIGVGRFGKHLAKKLIELGNDVVAVDKDAEKLERLNNLLTDSFVGDCTNEGVLRALGINNFDVCFVCTAEDFQSSMEITSMLKELGAKFVSCGYDYRYGKGGKGNAETLRETLGKKGVEVFTVPAVDLKGEVVSSTKIRQLISEGEVEKGNRMLGKEFSYHILVEKGDGIGHTIGTPTINQYFPEDFIVPKYGVYASRVKVEGKFYPSVTNVGIRPTVGGTSLRSETCIFDFSGDLYGKKVEVFLIKYIRGEKKFSSVEELKKAIGNDIENARKIYEEVYKNEKR